jgi:hypothetical protein
VSASLHPGTIASRLAAFALPATLSPWFLSPAVFVLAAGATFLLLSLRTASVTASTPHMNPLFDARGASLDLRIQTDGPGLLLRWNRYSPAVQSARSGVLGIQDGSEHHQIALDRNQIVNGSVFYRPASSDVSFRLDLRDASGSDVAQILRVLDSSPRKPESTGAPTEASNAARVPARPATSSKEQARESADGSSSRQSMPAPVQIASAQPVPVPPPTVPAPSTADPVTALMQPTAAQPPPASIPQPAPQSAPAETSAASKAPSLPAYVPPRPVNWVQPEGASSVSEPLDIKVKVRIDETGHVTAAHALIEGPHRDRKLMAAAAAAVRQWIFEPAKSYGTNVPCEETIVIHLGPEAQ